MGGRASLILVIGFAAIFGFINLQIARITSRSIAHMVGYNQSSLSRNAANAGINVGLAMLSKKFYRRGILKNQYYNDGPLARCGYIVRMDSIYIDPDNSYLRLRCVSACTTFAKTVIGNNPVILNDTVEVRFDCQTEKSYSTLGWMTEQEGNVFFITGDTLWGKIHSNSNIHISGSPVFKDKVTTSGTFDPAISTKKKPTNNTAIFEKGYETGVPEKDFPDNMNDVIAGATNAVGTRNLELWVELKPGTVAGADNDGYAIVRTGSFSGTRVDSISLSDVTNNVIYSSLDVHVKGTLDGRLSIGSGNNVKIENNIKYEKPPNPDLPLSNPVNQTKDMLGLIANNNVQISTDFNGNSPTFAWGHRYSRKYFFANRII